GDGAGARLLEQRVLLQLVADEGLELEVRELEQLDRELQLGRHHQLLGNAQLLLQLEGHLPSSRGSAILAPAVRSENADSPLIRGGTSHPDRSSAPSRWPPPARACPPRGSFRPR